MELETLTIRGGGKASVLPGNVCHNVKVEGRPAALRALILYPLNALVEDQLMRLRRACDSPEARQWLNQHRGENRFYFGRYTGLTPVPGQENSGQTPKTSRTTREVTQAS